MKIAMAQTRPVKGDIGVNTRRHKTFIEQAAGHGAEAIIFPELSITGYEPGLAKYLATTPDDSGFDVFDELSERYKIDIGLGVPLQSEEGINISMIIFSGGKKREVYSKQYLHQDEEPFFVAGKNEWLSFESDNKVSLAICYELSVEEHAEGALKRGSGIYIASVAKTLAGVAKAAVQLSGMADRNSMVVMMSNCVGYCDDFECAGGSAAWGRRGELIGQLGSEHEGILVVDTVREELIACISEVLHGG